VTLGLTGVRWGGHEVGSDGGAGGTLEVVPDLGEDGSGGFGVEGRQVDLVFQVAAEGFHLAFVEQARAGQGDEHRVGVEDGPIPGVGRGGRRNDAGQGVDGGGDLCCSKGSPSLVSGGPGSKRPVQPEPEEQDGDHDRRHDPTPRPWGGGGWVARPVAGHHWRGSAISRTCFSTVIPWATTASRNASKASDAMTAVG